MTRIVNSNLDTLVLNLGRACDSPSRRELDRLVGAFCEDERMLSRLATVLAEHDLDLSQQSFDAFSRLLFADDPDGASAAAWMLLGSNDPVRLGSLLDQLGWSWSSSKPQIENIMGSRAISASNRGSSFSDFAARIAPSELLDALSLQERTRENVKLAVDLLSAALCEYPGSAPESGLDIYHDHEAALARSYNFTIGDVLDDRTTRTMCSRPSNEPVVRSSLRNAEKQSFSHISMPSDKLGSLAPSCFTLSSTPRISRSCLRSIQRRWTDGFKASTRLPVNSAGGSDWRKAFSSACARLSCNTTRLAPFPFGAPWANAIGPALSPPTASTV